jgi:uncharacterized protein
VPVNEPPRARCDENPPELLLHGIEQFNRGEYFEQHETLETLWRAENGPVRDLYRGILQVGVALHHLRRGNFHGACVLFEEGMGRLVPFAPECQAVDIESLLSSARRAHAALLEKGAARIGEFDWSLAPRVQLRGKRRAAGP